MVLFFTPVTSGVITGVAAPINSSTLWLPPAASHTLPELLIAMPYRVKSTPAAV